MHSEPELHPEDRWVHHLSAEALVLRTMEEEGPRLARFLRLQRAPEALEVEAADILQEFALFVFKEEARRLRAFQGRSKARYSTFVVAVFRNWLFRQLAHKRLKLARTSQMEKKAEFSPDPAIILHRKDLYMSLIQCMRQLEPEHRRLLYARFMRGLTVAEMARKQGINVNVLYARFRSALSHLHNLLGRAGIRPDSLEDL